MVRIVIAALLVLHGMIHFFGFAKAFQIAEIPQLLLPISEPTGVLWLIAGVLCLVAAGGFSSRHAGGGPPARLPWRRPRL